MLLASCRSVRQGGRTELFIHLTGIRQFAILFYNIILLSLFCRVRPNDGPPLGAQEIIVMNFCLDSIASDASHHEVH